MRQRRRIVGGCWSAGSLPLEFVEEPVEICAVKDRRHTLLQGNQARAPEGFKGAALHADVGHCFGVREAAFKWLEHMSSS